MIEMKKLSNSQKLEMLIGKGVLFILEVIILMLLFWFGLFILNIILEMMTTYFWFTMLFVILDILLIINELKKI